MDSAVNKQFILLMGKWKVTPEKERHERTSLGITGAGAASFSGATSEESKNGNEAHDAAFLRSRSMSLTISSPRPLATIGACWTEVITVLKNSGSVFEAASCLREVEAVLRQIPKEDRLAFCKDDFETAVHVLRSKKTLNTVNLMKECVRIVALYFDQDKINKLPEVLLQKIFSYHQPHKIVNILTTCKEWYRLGLSKPLWQDLYILRFIRPQVIDAIAAADAALLTDGEAAESTLLRPVIHVSITDLRRSADTAMMYRSRVLTPMLLDRVEVIWKGKFRLDYDAIYSGLGWWTAEVISHRDRHLKIRYPGWSERWEEWVPRSKIRMATGGDIDSDITVGDVVEVWCTGQHVSGVWLLCQVKKIKRGKYGFDNVCSTGMMWADRSRVRPAEFSGFNRNHIRIMGPEDRGNFSRRISLPSMDSCSIS